MLFLHWHYNYFIHLFYFSCKKGGEDNRGVIYKPGMYKEEEDISKIWCPALLQKPLFIHSTDLFWIGETHLLFLANDKPQERSKTHASQKFSVALVLLFSREIQSVNPPVLNSSPHSFHVCCLLSLGVLIGFTVNPKPQFYGLFSTGFPIGIQIPRHSSSYKHSSLLKQGIDFGSMNRNKIKGKLYLIAVFELGCSANTALKSTGYDASAFTNGTVILEERTSGYPMKATWVINGLQGQELSAEKTLLLEEQLPFQILHSPVNLLRKSTPDCHWN